MFDIYKDIACQPHILIAGRTGCGKSTVINGVLYNLIMQSPAMIQLILIDPKRVELNWYKDLPHCIEYTDDPSTYHFALQHALDIISSRTEEMKKAKLRQYNGSHVYVIIDELADIMTDAKTKKICAPLIQRICQIGRCANVHMILASQCTLASVITTPIKVNLCMLGLQTRSAQDSRNIIGYNGCESLPNHGKGIYVTASYNGFVDIPFISEETISEAIQAILARRKKPIASATTSIPASEPTSYQNSKSTLPPKRWWEIWRV